MKLKERYLYGQQKTFFGPQKNHVWDRKKKIIFGHLENNYWAITIIFVTFRKR